MIRAILQGRKTMTRRVMNPQLDQWDFDSTKGILFYEFSQNMSHHSIHACSAGVFSSERGAFEYLAKRHCPYGVPGDRLWVRETWQPVTRDIAGFWVRYAADESEAVWAAPYEYSPLYDGKWKPSIFMPRWASRITLEITDIRVERVQDITPEDCVAEGIEGIAWQMGLDSTKQAFKELWDSINGKRGYGWKVNPWVWVVEFTKLKGV
jgi:hypothetical protein